MATRNAPVMIGVLGAPSLGRGKLIRQIEKELETRGVALARTGQLGNRAAAIGLAKKQYHTVASTEWIITQGIADAITAAAQGPQAILADGPPHEALAYLNAALEYRGERIHRHERERLLLLASTQLPKYDLLLATVLDTARMVEQRLDDNSRYRVLVDLHTHALLTEEQIPHLRVTNDLASQTAAIEKALRLFSPAAV